MAVSKTAYERVFGYLFRAEACLLQRHAEGKNVLEIGSYKGRSAVAMAAVCTAITCCDTFEGNKTGKLRYKGASDFLRNTQAIKDKLTLLTGDFTETLEGKDLDEFDFFFYDAEHDYHYTKAALDMFEKYGKPIAVHDYGKAALPDVQKAVDEFCQQYEWNIVEQQGSLVILTKDENDGRVDTEQPGQDG